MGHTESSQLKEKNILVMTEKNVIKNETEKSFTSNENFYWENLRWRKEDSQSIRTSFESLFKDRLTKIEKWNKYWDQFVSRHLNQQKQLWKTQRLKIAGSNDLYFVTSQDKNNRQKTQKRTNRREFLQNHYKMEYDTMVQNIKSTLEDTEDKEGKEQLWKNFCNTIDIFLNPEKIMEEYFSWPSELTIEDVKQNKLPLHFQWVADNCRIAKENTEDEILDILKKQQEVFGEGIVARLIIHSLSNTNEHTFLGTITSFIASRLTPLGLNHLSLQLGPYLIHWTNSSLVTLHNIGDHQNVFALLYPDPQFRLYLRDDKDKLLKLCNIMAKYNASDYNKYNHNCQNFVFDALDALECKKKWIKDGPIEKYLEHVSKLDCGVSNMSIWDLNNKQHSFKTYADFVEFCKTDPNTQEVLNNRHLYEKEMNVKWEYLQILKAIERGFQIQSPNEKKEDNTKLLFPIESYEKVNSITSLPPVTI